MPNSDDTPIKTAEDDKFERVGFAETIAKGVLAQTNSTGTVFAISGAWGSGKSSLINLVLEKIDQANIDKLEIIHFNCWWFKGEEALTLEFFRHLYSVMPENEREVLGEAVSNMASRYLSGGAGLAGLAASLSAPGSGKFVEKGIKHIGNLIKQEKTIEQFYKDLSKKLKKSKHRYLVIIDDIDRLLPEEAILIFRLIKSVGRLPYVSYLMAFDKVIASRITEQYFPSEGAQYLEKIIQTSFDLPMPTKSQLQSDLIGRLNELWFDLKEINEIRFFNLLIDLVLPEVNSPRDIIRIMNSMNVAWFAVKGEVDPTDFLCIETLRIQQPQIYRELPLLKEVLTSKFRPENQQILVEELERKLLSKVLAERQESFKNGLQRLFPALEAIWGNKGYSRSFYKEWSVSRLVCIEKHFDTYFNYSLSSTTLSQVEIDVFITKLKSKDLIRSALIEALRHQATSGTKVKLLLDELTYITDKIPQEEAQNLIEVLCELHGSLDVEEDKGKGFSIAGNSLRIIGLIERLLINQVNLEQRSKIMLKASKVASLEWLAYLADRANSFDYDQKSAEEDNELCLFIESDVNELKTFAINRIKESLRDQTILKNKDIILILYSLKRMGNENDLNEIQEWIEEVCENDEAILIFSTVLISKSKSFGFGDRVSKENKYVSKQIMKDFFKKVSFKEKVLNLLEHIDERAIEEKKILQEFLDAWDETGPFENG